jgi:hypothetical protein
LFPYLGLRMATRAQGEPVVVVAPKRVGVFRAGLLAAVLVAAGWLLINGIPSLNPFGTRTIDRSPPPVLRSIQKLSEFHAATANLQQVVDIERDAKLLPSFISGSRTTFLATGSVDAVVSFDQLNGSNVRVSKDGKTATVVLPAPHLAKPRVDMENSRVIERDRGLAQRVASVFEDSPTSERAVVLKAQSKMAAAAARDGRLLQTARDNTRGMLTQMITGLGVPHVIVRFQAPRAAL